MDRIIVKKDGLYGKTHIGYDQYEEIKVHSFLPYLNSGIEIEDDVTFEDFFNHIMRQHGKYSQVFASHLGHFKLIEWQDEWNRIAVMDDHGTSYTMTHLHVQWDANSFLHEGETKPNIDIHCDFSGVGIDNGKEIGIAVEFTPLNELKPYPLKLNKDFNLYDRFGPKLHVAGICEFTVYDVISCILYEISFAGPPESRDTRIAEINRRAEEVEKGIAKLIPAEEVFENLRNRIEGKKDEENSE